jgi:hypothetical protein
MTDTAQPGPALDLVNAFFQRHYPADLDRDKFEWDGALGGMWKYPGPRADALFPEMVCADGFSMSVQGHEGAYSKPRDDFAERYTHVEVYLVSEPEPLLNQHDDKRNEAFGFDLEPSQRAGMDQPCGYVPVEVIEQIIAKHGGLKE